MPTPVYCNENNVYDECGMDAQIVKDMSGKNDAQVTSLINGYIVSVEGKINDRLGIPITQHRELHRGTGEDDEFQLGCEDELGFFTVDVAMKVLKAYACYFSRRRMKLPYPKECDLCEKAYDWSGVVSNCTVTDDDGSALTADASEGASSIAVASGAIFEEGDRILVKDGNNSEYVVVKSVDGNTVTITGELRHSYTTAASAKAIGPVICGDKTVKLTFSAAGYARYPRTSDNRYINKNIDIFDFVSLRVKCDNAAAVITIKLYDKDGNCNPATFSVDKANVWYFRSFDIDNDFTGSIDWDDTYLYYVEVAADRACAVWIDNLNFNDEWSITHPKGVLCVSRKYTDEPKSSGYQLYVTYTYNPYLHVIPYNLKEAAAKLAAVKLLDFLTGIRQRDIAFSGLGDTMVTRPDRDQLYYTRKRLLQEAEQCLADIGYGWEFVAV